MLFRVSRATLPTLSAQVPLHIPRTSRRHRRPTVGARTGVFAPPEHAQPLLLGALDAAASWPGFPAIQDARSKFCSCDAGFAAAASGLFFCSSSNAARSSASTGAEKDEALAADPRIPRRGECGR